MKDEIVSLRAAATERGAELAEARADLADARGEAEEARAEADKAHAEAAGARGRAAELQGRLLLRGGGGGGGSTSGSTDTEAGGCPGTPRGGLARASSCAASPRANPLQTGIAPAKGGPALERLHAQVGLRQG
jgi:hypothetical protein